MRITVARDQRVIRIYLVIEARAEGNVSTWNQNTQPEIRPVQVGIKHGRLHQLVVVNFTPLKIDEVRRLLFHERTTEVSAVLPDLKRRPLGRARRKGLA